MLNVSQYVLNQVAKEPTLEYKITKHLFSQPQEQIDQAFQDLIAKFLPSFQAQNPDMPVDCLIMLFLEILPIYLDNQAICNYCSRWEDYQLRIALPIIFSPEDAIEVISSETILSPKDKAILKLAFQNSKDNFPKI